MSLCCLNSQKSMQIFSDDFETIHYCYFCSSPELQAIISYNSTKQKHVNYL